jgi:hypothetical protein
VMCDGNELNAASTRTSISVHASRGRKYCVEHGKYRRSYYGNLNKRAVWGSTSKRDRSQNPH